MIGLADIKRREFKAGGDPGPESFCTIIDSSSLWEGIFSIYTIRQFHSQPIYVICDKIAEEHINLSGIENVHTRATIDAASNSEITDGLFNGGFQGHNKNWVHYHPVSLLYRKPEAMDFALETNSSTLFSDCDVYYVEPIRVFLDAELGFYPIHSNCGYSKRVRQDIDRRYGYVTGAYVYTSRKDFPDWWRRGMIEDSNFYDEECLSRADDSFKVGFFPASQFMTQYQFDFVWGRPADYDGIIDRPPLKNMRDLGWNFMDGLITHQGRAVAFHFHIDPGSVIDRGQIVDPRARMLGRIFLTALERSSREEHKNILEFFGTKIRRHITPLPDKWFVGKEEAHAQ